MPKDPAELMDEVEQRLITRAQELCSDQGGTLRSTQVRALARAVAEELVSLVRDSAHTDS